MRRLAKDIGPFGGVLIAAVLLAVVAPLCADGRLDQDRLDSLSGSAKIDAIIEEVVERQRGMRSMSADFVQVRSSELLLSDVRSTGEFSYLAPDRVRWDYEQPDEMVVLFADDWVTTYHPDDRRAERVKVSSGDRRFVQALAGTLPMDDLLSYFSITFADRPAPEPYLFTLEPTAASLRKRLQSLHLAIDRTLLLPVVVEFREADGDSTRYEFHGVQVDPGITASRFRLDLGGDVSVQTIDPSPGIG